VSSWSDGCNRPCSTPSTAVRVARSAGRSGHCRDHHAGAGVPLPLAPQQLAPGAELSAGNGCDGRSTQAQMHATTLVQEAGGSLLALTTCCAGPSGTDRSPAAARPGRCRQHPMPMCSAVAPALRRFPCRYNCIRPAWFKLPTKGKRASVHCRHRAAGAGAAVAIGYQTRPRWLSFAIHQ
jgi:hypothetical protein